MLGRQNFRRPVIARPLALLGLLLLLTACGGDESGPTGVTPVVEDQITVSLDRIDIIADCDGGAGGEFAYLFYVVIEENGEDVETLLSTSYSSFTAGNNTGWDPGVDTTFTLQRRAGLQFRVRMRMRELDAVEHFSSGIFVQHGIESGRAAWSPVANSVIDEYTLYDSAKQRGMIEWDIVGGAQCSARMTYSVTIEPAGS